MLQQQNITGKILVFVNFYYVSHFYLFPSDLAESYLVENFNLTMVLLLITRTPLPVLKEILHHGNQHNNDQGEEHGGLALGHRNSWNHLQDPNQQKVNYGSEWHYCWMAW